MKNLSKNKKILLGVGLVAVLGVVVYFVTRPKKEKTSGASGTGKGQQQQHCPDGWYWSRNDAKCIKHGGIQGW